MKRVLLILSIAMLLGGCIPVYQQIATLSSNQVEFNTQGKYIAETPTFSIEYDFWDSKGVVGFLVTNNSDSDLFLNLSDSYLVNNGYAYDYFQNRIYGFSQGQSSTNSSQYSIKGSIGAGVVIGGSTSGYVGNGIVTSYSAAVDRSVVKTDGISIKQSRSSNYGQSVEYVEQKTICIPARSSKYFEEFSVTNKLIRECGLPRNPSKRENVVKKYTQDNSPRTMENRLVFVHNNETIHVVHTFYISEICNIAEKQVTEKYYPEKCDGSKSLTPIIVHKLAAPNKFYISYSLGEGDDTDR